MDSKLKRIIKIFLITITAYFLYKMFPGIKEIFRFLFKIILPFLIGFTAAFILEPLVEWFMRRRMSRKWGVFFTCVIVFGAIIAIVVIAFPYISHQLTILINQLPTYISNISTYLEKISQKLSFLPDDFLPTPENLEIIISTKIQDIMGNMFNIIQGIFSYLLIIVISPILMIYFLIDYEKLVEKIKDLAEKRNRSYLYDILADIQIAMREYFKGIFLVIMVLTILSTVCFAIIGLDVPFLWGMIVGITDIIPYIGPYLGGGIVVIFAFTISYQKGIISLVIIVILQILESNFLTPKIQSRNLKINPIFVLLSIAFFGEIGGIFGILLAVPLLCIIQICFKYFYQQKNLKNIQNN